MSVLSGTVEEHADFRLGLTVCLQGFETLVSGALRAHEVIEFVEGSETGLHFKLAMSQSHILRTTEPLQPP